MTWLQNLTQSISAANISFSIGPHPLTEARNGLSEVVNAPIQWGFVTGFILASYLHYLARHLKWMRKVQDVIEAFALQVKYSLKLFGSLFLAILLIPLFACMMCGFAAYRKCLRMALQREYKGRFCGLLEGHDANWVLEDDKCKSVINVLGTFEGVNSSAQILMALRKRLASRLLGKHQPHPKLFYRRGIAGGFAFWYKVYPSEIFIEDFVRLVDIPSESSEFVTSEEIKTWIGQVYNSDLPKGHSTSWEILVSKKPLGPLDPTKGTINPVIQGLRSLINSFRSSLVHWGHTLFGKLLKLPALLALDHLLSRTLGEHVVLDAAQEHLCIGATAFLVHLIAGWSASFWWWGRELFVAHPLLHILMTFDALVNALVQH